jgi:hypothetical protein
LKRLTHSLLIREGWGLAFPGWGVHPLLLGTTLILALASCTGDNAMEGGTGSGKNTICTSGQSCCKPEEITCSGSPDGKMVCGCYKSWDCTAAVKPEKCTQNGDTPDGTTGWSCRVQGDKEYCTRSGSTAPAGKNGWICTVTGGSIECSRTTNTPDGSSTWGCSYEQEFKTCLQQGSTTPTPTPTPNPTPGQGQWICDKDSLGNTVCKKSGEGMPTGGGNWLCFWKQGTITCEGESSTPPGGGSWTCTENKEMDKWRCTRPTTSDDTPPGGGSWSCVSGSEFGGEQCTQAPPTPSGAECVPGQQRWCDGEVYCSYGIQVCKKDGTWEDKCVEAPEGRRPNTVCACYYFFFNKACCETPDCILPPGTNGQVCPASKGQYCDYCNPIKPECVGAGSKCILGTNHETFCGQDCAGGKGCPTGSKCAQAKSQGKTYYQCVPNDGSCYH